MTFLVQCNLRKRYQNDILLNAHPSTHIQTHTYTPLLISFFSLAGSSQSPTQLYSTGIEIGLSRPSTQAQRKRKQNQIIHYSTIHILGQEQQINCNSNVMFTMIYGQFNVIYLCVHSIYCDADRNSWERLNIIMYESMYHMQEYCPCVRVEGPDSDHTRNSTGPHPHPAAGIASGTPDPGRSWANQNPQRPAGSCWSDFLCHLCIKINLL